MFEKVVGQTFEGMETGDSWNEYIPLAVWGDGVPYSKKENLLQVMRTDGFYLDNLAGVSLKAFHVLKHACCWPR